MTITVRDKDFQIELVNNWVTEKYNELFDLASFDGAEYVSTVEDLNKEGLEESEKVETRKEKREIKEKYKELLRIEHQKAIKVRDDIIKLRQAIIKELLESNGYEYDNDWWLRRASVEDNNDFMTMCLKQDFEPIGSTVSKKK